MRKNTEIVGLQTLRALSLVWGRISSRFGAILALLGIIGFGIAGVVGVSGHLKLLFSTTPGLIGLGAAVLYVIGFIVDSIILKSRRELATQLEQQTEDMRSLETRLQEREKANAECFRRHLSMLAEALEFDATERLTVFKVTKDNMFAVVGRFSRNAAYDRVHRTLLPADQGIVARAFTTASEAFWEPLNDPIASPSMYDAEQESEYNVPAHIAKHFTMRSISYAAFPINDFTGLQRTGILLAESTSLKFSVTLLGFRLRRRVEERTRSLQFFIEAANFPTQPALHGQRSKGGRR